MKIRTCRRRNTVLDEVAEMPLHFQTKLLNLKHANQSSWRIKNIPVDVRIIAATTVPLEMIKDGLFREDLYYRLMVLNLEIPPLREHPEDIVPCAEHFGTFGEKKPPFEKNAQRKMRNNF